jgi:hypothetical protein
MQAHEIISAREPPEKPERSCADISNLSGRRPTTAIPGDKMLGLLGSGTD